MSKLQGGKSSILEHALRKTLLRLERSPLGLSRRIG